MKAQKTCRGCKKTFSLDAPPSRIKEWQQALCRPCFILGRHGTGNPAWKDNKVKYGSLHDYIKWHLPKPNKCQDCDTFAKLDLANISQTYLRDVSDWEWICRRCHMKKDGRLEKFKNSDNGRRHGNVRAYG